VIEDTPQLTYLILTKRSGNIARRLADLKRSLPQNVWLGATIGHQQDLPLLKPLLRADTRLRFLSCEPLLTDLPQLDLAGIGWVIGGAKVARARERLAFVILTGCGCCVTNVLTPAYRFS
jgi:protein gp37